MNFEQKDAINSFVGCDRNVDYLKEGLPVEICIDKLTE